MNQTTRTIKTKLAIAVALLALAGSVFGAHWKPVSVTPQRSIYIDMDALTRNGNTVQAWDWQKFGAAQSATWQGTFYWVKSLTNYHCAQRTTDPVLKVYFGNDGVEIKRAHLEGLQFPVAVEPDSLREKMLEMACNPPMPGVKPGEMATKPAAESKAAESQSAPKPDATASAGKIAGVKSDKTVEDNKPAKSEDKAATVAKAVAVDAAVPGATPAVKTVRRTERGAHSRHARLPKQKAAAGLKLAKARPQRDLVCPPSDQAVTAQPIRTPSPTQRLSDAGNDGMFN